MNKKGNIFFGATLALVCFIAGVLIIPFFTDDITVARNQLDCTNTTITDGTKVSCLLGDMVIPYFIWFFVSLAIGIIGGINK